MISILNRHVKRQQETANCLQSGINDLLKFTSICVILLLTAQAKAQAPYITYPAYTGPMVFTEGTAITALTPSNSGGTLISTGLTSLLAGSAPPSAGALNGTGTGASFNQPLGAAVDASGNIYIADAGNELIRKITPAGVVSTLAGYSGLHGFDNGSGTSATFYRPVGLAVDGSGNVYVADEENNAIRKITSGGVVSTLAGTGSAGNANGSGASATFNYPCGVAIDGSGNVYVADYNNNLIRKITSAGVVSTFAGSGTAGSSNGTSTSASFYHPNSITIDASGNLYVADAGNNMIRKITSGAVVSTLAGSTTAGSSDGSGASASFNGPTAVAVYGSGNIYVADYGNNKIRMVTPAGVVTTFAGNGSTGATNGLVNNTEFNIPFGVAVDASGNVYETDYGNNQVRKSVPTFYNISPALPGGLSFNTATGVISGTSNNTAYPADYVVTAFSTTGGESFTLNLGIGLVNTADQGNLGFVQQENIKVNGITTDALIYPLSVTQKQTTRVYTDGMGRVQQTVGVQASPLQHDLIQPVYYDALGRQTVSYLPYAGQATDVTGSYRPNAISNDQPNFYNNSSQYLIPVDTGPRARQIFESSPLQRLLESGMTGNGYQPNVSASHYKTVLYRSNTSSDGNIMLWNPDGSYTASSYYTTGMLSVTIGTDESGSQTQVFNDFAGHTVLKRQIISSTNVDTYYIYNNAGMLAFIIPPGALSLMKSNGSYSITQTGVSALIFQFTYDTMGRLITKTVPGKGAMSIVYDPMNRPVLMQDAYLNSLNEWNYIRYDAKGRIISQGIYTDATSTRLGRANMQTYINTNLVTAYNTIWYEIRSTSSATGYYTASIFPTTATGTLTPLVYAYFDNYDLTDVGGGHYNYSYVAQGLTNEESQTLAQVKGMPTMTRSTTVGSGIAANTWLTKVIFYDKHGNPIQEQSNNQLYNTTDVITDYQTTVPDFMGVPQITQVSKKTASGTTITVQTTFSYDHMYRVTSVSQSYNGGTITPVAAYSYNEVGQVIKKGLGYVSSSTWLQNVDMRYNIRGQLLYINNSQLADDYGVTNNDGNDVFGMQFLYDQQDASLSNTPYYDGQLSAVKWMSKDASGNKSYERSYKYNYDQLKRYTSSNYSERTPGATSFSNNVSGFDEVISYTPDNSGNINTLTRNSSTEGTNSHVQIDNLAYTYDPANPDQLHTVSDGTGTNYTGAGFRNLTSSTGNYVYDVNSGNLTQDPYKGLSIGYNYLNRTDKITVTTGTGQWIDYTYDASGNILHKRQYSGSVLTTYTDYVDGFVYVNGTLSYFPMPEGRVLNTSGTLTQEFVITDQQGNARVSFTNNSSSPGNAIVTQENSYYATGMIMPNSPVYPTLTVNKNLYNGGSEWQNDYNNLPDYYQTYNRNYDAAVARFIGVDPVAESAESMTSYQYAGNNPVMMNDPDGDLINPAQVCHPVTSPSPGVTMPLTGGVDYAGSPTDGGDAGSNDDTPFFTGTAFYGCTSVIDGGNYTQSWNTQLAGTGYSLDATGHAVLSLPTGDVSTSTPLLSDTRGTIHMFFSGNGNYIGQFTSCIEGPDGLLIYKDGKNVGMSGMELFSDLGLTQDLTNFANQEGEGLLPWVEHANDITGLVGERLDNAKIGIGTGVVTVALSGYEIGKGYKKDGNKIGPNTYSALHKAEGAVIGGYIGSRVGTVAGGAFFGALVGGLTDGIGTVEGIEFGQWVGGIGGGLLGSWIGGEIGGLKNSKL